MIYTMLWEMIKYQPRFLLLSIRNDSSIFLVTFLSLRRIILIFFSLSSLSCFDCDFNSWVSLSFSLSNFVLSFSYSDSKLIDWKLIDKYSSIDDTRNDDRFISWIYLRRYPRDASTKIRREMVFNSSIWSSSLIIQ